jgi:dihydropteroate synthase
MTRQAILADPQKNTNDTIRLGTLRIAYPAVMGILNVTPDSFSDGGLFSDLDAARQQAESMARDGAAIIDVGGESTRPGAADVNESQELDRVIPVIEAVRQVTDLPVSIDTSKPAVMRHAVAAGAAMINDVAALQGEGALQAAVELDVPVCLMHMQGRPRTMQDSPVYEDITQDVCSFLRQRIEDCVAAGIDVANIVVDPGFGFGKTHAHNVELLANLRQLVSLGSPVLVGLSRKSTLGEITGRSVDERLAASIATAVIAYRNGAGIIRVHDVRESVDALRVAAAVMEYTNE